MTNAADAADSREWDRFYVGDGSTTARWSGQPNPTLVADTVTLHPGRALDVGCGEGADAIWLAEHGWQVTAIDPSIVALERARAAADRADVEVTWVRATLPELPHDGVGYDLVTAHYPVLRRGDDAALVALLRAVAPGGTLLFVHHERDRIHAAEHGGDPSDHLMPDDLAAALDAHWELQAFETRERSRGQDTTPGPRDIVLRAQRHLARR